MENEEAEVQAFSSIRDRFEKLSRAGPSLSSRVPTKKIGMRVSSDRLHDRVVAPPTNLPLPPSLLTLPPTSPVRARTLSNPDSSDVAQFTVKVQIFVSGLEGG